MATFHAVVWVDHSEAHVLMFDREHLETQRIKSRSHHKPQDKAVDTVQFFDDITKALVGHPTRCCLPGQAWRATSFANGVRRIARRPQPSSWTPFPPTILPMRNWWLWQNNISKSTTDWQQTPLRHEWPSAAGPKAAEHTVSLQEHTAPGVAHNLCVHLRCHGSRRFENPAGC